MVLIPALASVLATLIVITYPIQEYSATKKDKKKEAIRKNSIEEEFVG